MAWALKGLAELTLRANPRYALRGFDELAPDARAALAELERDVRLAGVLAPTGAGAGAHKAICRDTAELFASLREPVPAATAHAGASSAEIAALVLDEILEVEVDGTFVSGPAAFSALYGEHARDQRGANRLAELSRQALRYASLLPVSDVNELAARLYCFNRLPVSGSSLRRWPDPASVAAFLGLDAGGANRSLLDGLYRPQRKPGPHQPWSHWSRRERDAVDLHDRCLYKLYVSPMPTDARAAVAAVVETLQDRRCDAFKVGNDAFGLARPDKIVCYFTELERLTDFAEGLRERVGVCAAHGVPFSASLTDDGLLSWGVDPPLDTARASWEEPESWRLWVANTAARALLLAREQQLAGVAPWEFALERLSLAGVDTETWSPDPTRWTATSAPRW